MSNKPRACLRHTFRFTGHMLAVLEETGEDVWVYMWKCRRCSVCFVWDRHEYWNGGVPNDYFAPTVVTDAELEAWLS